MMSNNKILTVSYGTFSCTLEGFDDSFGTMKAIAEYFRGLAADDRYFGAEPPQPDADMLARIAEREIARRVEVHASDKGIHLRTATELALPDTSPAPAPGADTNAALQDSREAAAEAATDGATAENAQPDDGTAQVAPEVAGDEPADTPDDAGTPDPVSAPQDAHESVDGANMHAAPDTEAETTRDDASTTTVAETVAPEIPHASPGSEPGADHTEGDESAADAGSAVPDAEDPEGDIQVAEDITPVPAQPAPNSIAEKLQRIRAVVSKTRESDSAYCEDEHAGEILDHAEADNVTRIAEFFRKGTHAPAHAPVDTPEEIAEPRAAEASSPAPCEAPAEATTDPTLTDSDTDCEPETLVGSEPDTIAEADLVEAGAPDAPDEHPLTEDAETLADEHAAIDPDADTSVASDDTTQAAPVATDAQDLSFEEDATDDAGQGAPDEFSAALARLAEDFEGEQQADTSEATPVAEPSESAETTGEADEDGEDGDEDHDVSSLLAEEDDEATTPVDLGGDIDDPFATTVAADPSDGPDAEAPAVRARVIKVKRTDITAALESGVLEETDPTGADDDMDIDADEIRADGTSSAADDVADDVADEPDEAHPAAAEDDEAADEADLIRRLSDTDAAAEDDAEANADTPGARTLKEVAASDEKELDRLMAEADQQMEEPEGTSRRAAFSHLRGAVAATRADENLGSETETDEQGYRTDLAAAVKPRRPVVGEGGRSDRPRDQRPAPLKLVAEQRIDVPAAKAGPVRPRRVAAEAEPEDGASARSFADYAAARGAHDLPDLLEAAASYLSFVEGRDQFSRPQLMTKVRQLDPEGFSREDGLHHFGQLLRSGKIEKIKGGQFTVSDDIGFRPDGERAAG